MSEPAKRGKKDVKSILFFFSLFPIVCMSLLLSFKFQ